MSDVDGTYYKNKTIVISQATWEIIEALMVAEENDFTNAVAIDLCIRWCVHQELKQVQKAQEINNPGLDQLMMPSDEPLVWTPGAVSCKSCESGVDHYRGDAVPGEFDDDDALPRWMTELVEDDDDSTS